MADAHAKHHDFHLVNPSPWPFVASVGAFLLAIGGVAYMRWHGGSTFSLAGLDLANPWLLLVGLVVIVFTMYVWWRDAIREGKAGFHTPVVVRHLKLGMLLFIASEVMFFVAWFWAFFDASLFPADPRLFARVEATHGVWPPEGIAAFDPWRLPLLNTLILLTSGTSVTWAHQAILDGDRRGTIWGLVITIALGLTFTSLQAAEYSEAHFAFAGNIYGAVFFMATGFHGFHVIIGTIFLIVCLVRAVRGDFTPTRHFGFEAAAWYWHFVDVVWLFLFACIYVWGGGGGGH